MPHLQNCDHSEHGWCLDCVKALGDENQDLRLALMHVSNVAFQETFLEGHIDAEGRIDSDPDSIVIDKKDYGLLRLAMQHVSECCKKYLI